MGLIDRIFAALAGIAVLVTCGSRWYETE